MVAWDSTKKTYSKQYFSMDSLNNENSMQLTLHQNCHKSTLHLKIGRHQVKTLAPTFPMAVEPSLWSNSYVVANTEVWLVESDFETGTTKVFLQYFSQEKGKI